MSQRTRKELSQLLKTQLEKKSSKKTVNNVGQKKHEISPKKDRIAKEDLHKQKQKMVRSQNAKHVGARVLEEERFWIHLKILAKRAARFLMITFYCVVASIAICKAGIIILTAFQEFLHEIFTVAPSPTVPKSKIK